MRTSSLALLLPALLSLGCASTSNMILEGETSARLENARGLLGQMVVSANAVSPDRQVVHLSHTCSLRIDGAAFPVADMQEQAKAGGKGMNTILVFTPARAVLHRLEYSTQRPLSCAGNHLYLAGDLTVAGSSGNELTVGPAAQLAARHVDEVPGIMK
jgi:hypothetical protein